MSWFGSKGNVSSTNSGEREPFEAIDLKKEKITSDLNGLIEVCEKLQESLEKKKQEYSSLVKEIQKTQRNNSLAPPTGHSEVVDFNIGGSRFSISRTNIGKRIASSRSSAPEFYGANRLEALVNKTEPDIVYDSQGAIFIDRNPKYFGYVLDYLRQANTENPFKLPKNAATDPEFLDGLHEEAEFYQVHGLKGLMSGKNIPSNIINSVEDAEKFITLLTPVRSLIDPTRPWKLIYRATEHGFDALSFHKKCDDQPNTIVIFKVAETNQVFGGFTSIGWKSSGSYRVDPKAFVFSLKNRTNEPELMMCSSPQSAVLHTPDSGPVFGGGHDIYICSRSNASNLSYSKLGNSYKSEKIQTGSHECQLYLAGQTNFLLAEMEVFQQLS